MLKTSISSSAIQFRCLPINQSCPSHQIHCNIVQAHTMELSNKAYAEQGGNKSGGKCLIFVHRMISTDAEGAVYGPRHEIEITRSQREKRDALQSKIMKELGIENDQIVTIAIKVGVEWKIISQKPFPYHKPFD
eukprot:88541_1